MLPALLVCPPPVKVAWVPPVPEKSDMHWGEVSVILTVMGVNLPELEAAVFHSSTDEGGHAGRLLLEHDGTWSRIPSASVLGKPAG